MTVRANSIDKRIEKGQPANMPESLLILAWRILSVFGGYLEQTQSADGVLCIQITLMVAGGTPIMVIDDNSDVLQLYERYVLGTRYRLILCQKPEEALRQAAVLHPEMIVMDIMMPNLDGWSLLGQLCHHPLTSSIPVIVSTIVAERDLALTLGAVDFVQKPVTRGEFLDALTRWAGREAPKPR
jgi:CheY-like chemotaxis protein